MEMAARFSRLDELIVMDSGISILLSIILFTFSQLIQRRHINTLAEVMRPDFALNDSEFHCVDKMNSC